jgi:hypothetical protein
VHGTLGRDEVRYADPEACEHSCQRGRITTREIDYVQDYDLGRQRGRALTLAKLEPGRSTPRSKDYAVKIHWFRSFLKPNHIEIMKIDTKEQRADVLTKGLRPDTFEKTRKLLCGW